MTSSHGARMLSSDDDEQFALAVSEQRAIVTFNVRDFVEIHERYIVGGQEHWGIILSTEERPELGASTTPTPELRDADELKNTVRWLNEFK